MKLAKKGFAVYHCGKCHLHAPTAIAHHGFSSIVMSLRLDQRHKLEVFIAKTTWTVIIVVVLKENQI